MPCFYSYFGLTPAKSRHSTDGDDDDGDDDDDGKSNEIR